MHGPKTVREHTDLSKKITTSTYREEHVTSGEETNIYAEWMKHFEIIVM